MASAFDNLDIGSIRQGFAYPGDQLKRRPAAPRGISGSSPQPAITGTAAPILSAPPQSVYRNVDIGGLVSAPVKALGTGIADAAGRAWDAVTGAYVSGAQKRYQDARAGLTVPDQPAQAQPAAIQQPPGGDIASLPPAMLQPAAPRRQADDLSQRTIAVSNDGALSIDGVPQSIGRPGTGYVRNNTTGATQVISPGVVSYMAAPQAPRQDIAAMPTLTGKGGIFSDMAQLAQASSAAGRTISNNRGRNAAFKNELAAADGMLRADTQNQRSLLDTMGLNQRGALEQQRYGIDQQRLAIDQQNADTNRQRLQQDRLRPVDVITGQDSLGQPIKSTMLIDIGKLGPDGNPIAKRLSPQAPEAALSPTDIRQQYRDGKLSKEQATAMLREHGYE